MYENDFEFLLAPFTPVELLLDGGCQFLIKALQVCKTDHECVPFRPDQLLCVPQVLHFSITILKPANGAPNYYYNILITKKKLYISHANYNYYTNRKENACSRAQV